jgi:hypothetical protein
MILLALCICLFGAMLVVPDLALGADGGVENAGGKLGQILGDWGRQIFVGIVALVAVFFLIQRKYTDLAIFGLAALFVGWLAMSPDGVANAGRDLLNSIVGG